MTRLLFVLLSGLLFFGFNQAPLAAQSYASDADELYLYRIHADSHYHIYGCSDDGDIVQLMDGSKWLVRYGFHSVVKGWAQSDDIFIKPRYSWFSSCAYVLHNRSLHQIAEVDFLAPLPSDAQTFRIEFVDSYKRQIILNDNTVWQIDADDRNFFYYKAGQRVIIGVNNNWRYAKFPNIIINIDLYNHPYSQADFFGYRVG